MAPDADDEDYDDDDLTEDDDDEEGPEVGVTVEVVGLSLYTHHGVTAAEREIGQRLVLDVRFDVGEPDALITDRVEDTVDYGEVCQVIALVAQQRSYKTLERLCAVIAERLSTQFGAESVTVKASKPEPPIPLPVEEVSVGERREEILAIAVRQFAEAGYRGTSTEAIAREAGISQPYLFRLFRTKRELFLACADRACAHVADVFRRVAGEVAAEERLERMGRAYVEELLPERHEILMLMQAFAAGSDPEIQAHVRAAYGALVTEVAELAEVPPRETFTFFGHGMLLNIVAALDIAAVADTEEWAAQWIERKDGP